jgi:hypothetical protein
MGMRRAWKKIRYRLEWLALKVATKFVPLLSRKACYQLALLLGSLGAMLDRWGRRVALSPPNPPTGAVRGSPLYPTNSTVGLLAR